jgi:hypothetical protein
MADPLGPFFGQRPPCIALLAQQFCQRAVGLMQRLHRGAFDRHCSCPPVADFANRLVGARGAAIPRPRRQPKGAADLTAGLEVSLERLVHQTAREDVAESFEAFQLAGLCGQRGVGLGALRRLDILDLTLHQRKPFGLASDVREQCLALHPVSSTRSRIAIANSFGARLPRAMS